MSLAALQGQGALTGVEPLRQIEQHLRWKAYGAAELNPVQGRGATHDGFAVVPHAETTLSALIANLSTMLDRLQWLKLLAPSPAEQLKYSHTARWIKSIRDDWQNRYSDYQRLVAPEK